MDLITESDGVFDSNDLKTDTDKNVMTGGQDVNSFRSLQNLLRIVNIRTDQVVLKNNVKKGGEKKKNSSSSSSSSLSDISSNSDSSISFGQNGGRRSFKIKKITRESDNIFSSLRYEDISDTSSVKSVLK